MTPRRIFARHPVVAIDSNVLIYLFEGHGALADAAAALLDGIEDGTASGVLASIGLTEVLTRPASLGDAASVRALRGRAAVDPAPAHRAPRH